METIQQSSITLKLISGAPKALVVALSFCRLLGLGCPKQAFAKIATPREAHLSAKLEFFPCRPSDTGNLVYSFQCLEDHELPRT